VHPRWRTPRRPPPSAHLLVSPLTVTVGQTLAVSGTTFGASEPLTLTWGGGTTTTLTTTLTTASGGFSLSVKAPAAVVGAHTLTATGQNSHKQATAMVTIKPKLGLKPTAGLPGSAVKATGSGFGATEQVRLHWQTATGTVLGTASSNAVGSVGPLSITIPTTATVGTAKVVAVGATSTAQATASFKVT
jgi:hypothetical protein